MTAATKSATVVKSTPKSKSKAQASAPVKGKSKSKPEASAPAAVVRQRSQRVTIFGKSLTSVMKTLGRDHGLTADQADAVMNKLADNDCSAVKRSTLTTALSDGRSEKYSENRAELTKDEVARALKVAQTVAPVAQAPRAPQPVKSKSAPKSKSKAQVSA